MQSDRVGIATRGPLWPLALFRIAFGLLYLDMAWQKAPWVITDGHRFGWLHGFIEKEIAHPTFGWYTAFLQGVVLPNFTLFGMLTFLTELGLGVLLLFGLLTRLAGLGGFLWQVNIALGAFNVPGEWGWIWVLLTLPQFCFALCGAGRVLGLDRVLEPALRQRAADAAWARLLLRAV
ncbi:MAG TPA: TQO small subunit DoxD [Candidatus Methylomirabilis sp.]|jgi:thiosulfate dehydrogenase [quinone] large subunit|nr:TQO small subunit DoxD [Candidatus Methylomirabilis sp.]